MQVCTGGFFSNFIEKEKQLVSRYDMYYSNIEKTVAIGFYRRRYGRWEVMEGDYDKGFFSGR